MNIYGFVGKPETAKKTRGDQYFFVNNRFIKSAYLNHAVMNAFSEMIAKDSFPMYALFIDLDPSQLDINVHPTKQEIKFEDEKIVYAFVQSAVKHALAQFSITPTLDFDLDVSIQQLDAVSKPFTEEKRSSAASSSLYKTFTQKNQAHFIESKSELKHWNDDQLTVDSEPLTGISNQKILLKVNFQEDEIKTKSETECKPEPIQIKENKKPVNDELIQLHNTFIVVQNDKWIYCNAPAKCT